MLTATTCRVASVEAVVDVPNRRSIPTLAALWQSSPPLTAVGILMSAAFVLAVAGLFLDPRAILGAPAWLKPAKFAVSTAIYAFTLAWVFTYLPEWRQLRRLTGWTTAVVFVVEVGLIAVQAWRGTTSHFNVRSAFDAAVFATMGLAIVAQTVAGVAVAVALWRQRFEDRPMGWALRLGMTISLIGSASGGLMTAPTSAQLAQLRETRSMAVSGAHTVGAPDGGPGLPGTGWSVDHGDLRVPHFLGLHAFQALPLVVILLRRRFTGSALTRLTMVAAAAHASLFALLLWQALRGESFDHPGPETATALAVWTVVTVTAAFAALRTPGVQAHAVAL